MALFWPPFSIHTFISSNINSILLMFFTCSKWKNITLLPLRVQSSTSSLLGKHIKLSKSLNFSLGTIFTSPVKPWHTNR